MITRQISYKCSKKYICIYCLNWHRSLMSNACLMTSRRLKYVIIISAWSSNKWYWQTKSDLRGSVFLIDCGTLKIASNQTKTYLCQFIFLKRIVQYSPVIIRGDLFPPQRLITRLRQSYAINRRRLKDCRALALPYKTYGVLQNTFLCWR